MRTYDELIEVRRGLVAGQEAPEQFLWRGRLWVVRDVLSHWVETGAWWEQAGVAALLGVGAASTVASSTVAASTADRAGQTLGGPGAEGGADSGTDTELEATRSGRRGADLLAERDVWRVEAGRGRVPQGFGVFDLSFDWSDARWRLISCAD